MSRPTLDEALNHAAAELPQDYQIVVYVEKGAAWVEWLDAESNPNSVGFTDLTLGEQVLEAIREAKADAKAAGQPRNI